MALDFRQARQLLQSFEFSELFVEILGWSNPTSSRASKIEIGEQDYQCRMIAQLSRVAVYEIEAPDGRIPDAKQRGQIQVKVAELVQEHLLIFVDEQRITSLWYWVKQEGSKRYLRNHVYVKGQPGDLFLGKLAALVVDISEFKNEEPSVVAIAQKLQKGLDVEQVTKKFFTEFKEHLEEFVLQIEGIDQESDRRWYASVILNRLMFVYFLQRKQFIDGNLDYLQDKLAAHESDDFYRDFLLPLFFEGFAQPEAIRSLEVKALLGRVHYLNGGLFLEHRIEQEYPEIAIGNGAFASVLKLFQRYSWNLDDTPGGDNSEINPGVLGYIFEKYINQKEFGAYYTRPEITEYLCDRTINQLILDKVRAQGGGEFESIGELVIKLDAPLCRQLLFNILPKLSLLDPACGSGAFLVAAMKTMISVYSAVIGRIKFLTDQRLTDWLAEQEAEHPSLNYFIKKRIITDNLYGVDIMPEALEIAKLRLFLALVSSAQKVEELEPLPNVDFNIMAGNSLIGLLRVEETAKDTESYLQGSLLPPEKVSRYQQILREKNESIRLYKEHSFLKHGTASERTDQDTRIEMFRKHIEDVNRESQNKLDQLLLEDFQELKIKYEQAQLGKDGKKRKPIKRAMETRDIERLQPFHWDYHFAQILNERDGFSAIITNPPWEIFQLQEKEFFAQYSENFLRNMDVKSFQKEKKKLLTDSKISEAWLEYQSQFSHASQYFRLAQQFSNQISIVNGKKVGARISLYNRASSPELTREKGDCLW